MHYKTHNGHWPINVEKRNTWLIAKDVKLFYISGCDNLFVYQIEKLYCSV